MPDDTVVSMKVSPRKSPLLSQSGFDLSGFKEVRTLDDHWNYVDEEKGILINTYVSSPTEKTVIFIDFSRWTAFFIVRILALELKKLFSLIIFVLF